MNLDYCMKNNTADMILLFAQDLIFILREILGIFHYPPPKRVIYACIDTLSIGDSDSINCESLLGLCFPIIGKLIKDKNERRL